MNISAHWLVENKTGREIDLIEAELRDITGTGVDRTDTPRGADNYNAHFKVHGDINAADLADACEYMDGIKAYPV